ncbi:glycosyltransferase [Ferruginibacter sp. SUN106]|uniref:glycosyltransferase n=1 Tax=Ferruginibacter sp. SUN106 TaxID=2978348 RepID=UPI003D36FA21
MQYPKILIIGQSFNKRSGGGVTISNLFKGWPKDRLAVASNDNLLKGLDDSVCEMYYQLGYNNKLHPFPLNIILPKIHCGIIPVVKKEHTTTAAPAPEKLKSGNHQSIYKVLFALLHFFGLYNFFYKLKVTPEFEQWISEYQPDIIYTQLASLELIRFVDDLQVKTKKPIAIHIMDDWPLTINKPGIFYNYWQNVIDKEFRKLLDKSTILMSICEAMSDEYKLRYGKDFIPFHNPIDINYWKPTVAKDYTVKDKFTILYAGRIGGGIGTSVADIAGAVNEIAATNKSIVFEIQTPDTETLNKLVAIKENVRWMKPIDYAALPAKFAGVDLLLLPQDFDAESIKFLKYSFPTKVSEYMISGTPILVYGDPQTAVTKYAVKDKWGYVVSEKNKNTLINAINKLYNNTELRKQLATTAQQIAVEREDSVVIREEFRKCFLLN